MENNAAITRAEVELEIKKQLAPVVDKMDVNFKELRDEQHRIAIAFVENTGYLKKIADNTEGTNQRMDGLKERIVEVEDRVEVVENEYELKKENQKGKWELLKVFFGAGGIITVIALAIIQFFGGFPTPQAIL